MPTTKLHHLALTISILALLEGGVSPFTFTTTSTAATTHGGAFQSTCFGGNSSGSNSNSNSNSNSISSGIHKSRTPRAIVNVLQQQDRYNSRSRSSSSTNTSTSTSLSMGIRSFLGGLGRGGKAEEDGPEENPEDIKAALEAIKADLEAVAQKEKEGGKMMNEKKEMSLKSKIKSSMKEQQQKASAATASASASASASAKTATGAAASASNSKIDAMYSKFASPSTSFSSSSSSSSSSKIPPSKSETSTTSRVKKAIHKITGPSSSTSSSSSSSPSISPSSRYGETVRDRVKRVKSGAMTEDEKLAFLNNALTPRTAPGKRGPRIRQAIPDAGDGRTSRRRGGGGGSSSSNSNRNSNSNGNNRTDALWNKVLGNTKSSANDMGRRGNRSPYNIDDVVGSDSAKRQYLDMVTDPNRFASYAAMNAPKPSPSVNPNESPVDSNSNSNSNQQTQTNDVEIEKGGVIDNLKSLQGNDKDDEDDSDSLANRLQSAAIMKEKQDAELKAQRDLERQAEKERIAEAQRQAAEEIRRREEEKIQRAREEQEKLMKQEEEKKVSEENRQKAILAAQEEYWANQLKKNGGGQAGGIGAISNEQKERNLQQVTMGYDNQAAIEKARARQVDESDILRQVS